MASKVSMYKLTGTISAGGAIDVYSSHVVRGNILAVHVNYPAHNVEVDLKTDGPVAQTILDLAAATTDRTVYPRTKAQDYTGTDIDLSDAQGGDTAMYVHFTIFGRLRLTCASGTAGEEVTVHILVEEY